MRHPFNLLEGTNARTSGGPVHVRGYTRTVQGQPVMVGDYDRSPSPGNGGGGDQPGQPGTGDQSNEPLPTFPDPYFKVFKREPRRSRR